MVSVEALVMGGPFVPGRQETSKLTVRDHASTATLVVRNDRDNVIDYEPPYRGVWLHRADDWIVETALFEACGDSNARIR